MKLSITKIKQFAKSADIEKFNNLALESIDLLLESKGKGNDFLGWLNLPELSLKRDYNNIIKVSEQYKNFDAVVVIGIGGSYLGAKAIIDALSPEFETKKPEILFAGHNLSSDYHCELIEYLKDKNYGIVVISKSGTTTEPAIAFRFLYDLLEKKYDDKEIKKRVVTITDANKGALRELTNEKGFESFIIDDNVGGRFSVLSAVGLLPIAIAGYDIDSLLKGALDAKNECVKKNIDNPAIKYAATRNLLYSYNYKLEIMVNYNHKLNLFSEWWKQLFGESEGKESKGIFPSSASFTTDLHSLGQYIQQGERFLFETVLYVNEPNNNLVIPKRKNDLDKLNYLASQNMEFVNKKACEGTLMAHRDGGVPTINIEIPQKNEYYLGQLIYFFQIACGISAYILDVNPFDQPGVEDYKKNMFKLLGK